MTVPIHTSNAFMRPRLVDDPPQGRQRFLTGRQILFAEAVVMGALLIMLWLVVRA